jgi:uncharacterized damage-inducible protein DinB
MPLPLLGRIHADAEYQIDMSKVTLPIPEGYNFETSPVVSTTAAQLDALLANLIRRVGEATPEQLEWQLRPGTNTIGMLLAHLAVVEVYWVEAVGRGIDSDEEANRIIQGILGIRMEEDGMPISENGTHPSSLAGKTADDYLEILRRARSATHHSLRNWDDRRLAETRMVDGREVSLAWLLYHLVEHFSYHLGQIAQLDGLRRQLQGG